MEKLKVAIVLLIMLLGVSSFPARGSFYSKWRNIDSGGTDFFDDPTTFVTWYTDDIYIQSGERARVSKTDDYVGSYGYVMETLRSFPTGTNNCYHLPSTMQGKYLIRAGFHYGNYDRRRKPPIFALEIDGNISLTVDTSVTNNYPIFHEVMLVTQKEYIDVCLVRTQKGHTPFISSLETAFIDEDVYKFMKNDTILYLERRTNYGANSSVEDRFNRYDEEYNRIWSTEEVPGYLSQSLNDDEPSTAENYPPYEVIVSATVAQNVWDSIFLPINFHQKPPLSAYFTFYFLETKDWYANETRKVAIYIDGQKKNSTNVTYDCRVVTVYPVNITTSTANVTISPAEGSSRPPLLNAMEVFSVMQRSAPIVEVEASKADFLLHFYSMYTGMIYFLAVLVWFGYIGK